MSRAFKPMPIILDLVQKNFRKYKNIILEDVVKKDQQYLQWLNTQPWFKIKHKDLHLKLNILLIRVENVP